MMDIRYLRNAARQEISDILFQLHPRHCHGCPTGYAGKPRSHKMDCVLGRGVKPAHKYVFAHRGVYFSLGGEIFSVCLTLGPLTISWDAPEERELMKKTQEKHYAPR